jgi:hypothetical protein
MQTNRAGRLKTYGSARRLIKPRLRLGGRLAVFDKTLSSYFKFNEDECQKKEAWQVSV